MKPAENIFELANNLNPAQPLGPEDRDVYVPIYTEILEGLKDRILFDDIPNQSFFVAGQSGTGKTTALNFLPDHHLDERYSIQFVRGNQLLDPNDLDIIDLLLVLAFKLVENHTPLRNEYYRELDRLQKIHQNVLTEEKVVDKERKASVATEGKASVGGGFLVKFGLSFFSRYGSD